MASASIAVNVPRECTRSGNTTHLGDLHSICDSERFSYGTAGFRQKSECLSFICFRVGYLAGLRSRNLGKTIGLMITASHNPECDNGVKIVDPMGEMLAVEWEKYASDLVNASDDELGAVIISLEVHGHSANTGRVVCAMDTRRSGAHLAAAARAGASIIDGVDFVDLGVLTTPQLHYIVRVENDPGFGPPLEEGYYQRFGEAFEKLYELTPSQTSSTPIYLDCSNGVGAQKMHMLESFLPPGAIDIHYFNESGELNHECGADFVKLYKKLPATFPPLPSTARCASLDGDADRLVYFRSKETESQDVTLLDGDKIAVLFAKYIIEQLREADLMSTLTVGIVQTAYANGASTAYIHDRLGVKPVFVPTGVKHLHHEAVKYDIGVYFEANGHGTVCFSDKFKETVSSATVTEPAKLRLKLFSEVVNEVVGDALADMLCVELLLRHYGWTVEDWDEQLYTDAPNIQLKVPVADRSIFKTTWDETTLLEPNGMQKQIDELVAQLNGIRCFLRPSGTENIVRVYAEASTPEATAALGHAVVDLVKNLKN